MLRNESGIDRIIRLVIAVVLVGAAALLGFTTVGGVIALVLAAVMVLTAAIGFCPLYRLLGLSTHHDGGAAAH